MRDIASLAGVSPMTVSRVLRNDPRHDKETRERVLEAAEKLGYRKNPFMAQLMAQMRRQRKSGFRPILALLHAPQPKGSIHPNLQIFRHALTERATALGCQVQFFPFLEEDLSPRRRLGILKARGIKGVIFEHLNTTGWIEPVSVDIDLTSFASVSIGFSLRCPELHRLAPDDYGNVRLAFRHLRERGYRRIGLVEPAANYEANDARRCAGFREAQIELPADCRVPVLVVHPRNEFSTEVARWLKAHRPDAVLSSVGLVARPVRAFSESAPTPAAFYNLGWYPGGEGAGGVDPNWEEVGSAAVTQLVDQLTHNDYGVPKFPRVTLVAGRWCEA